MTDAHALAGQIRRALIKITDYYDEALEPSRATSGVKLPTAPTPPDARKIKPAGRVFEHSPMPLPLAVLERRLAVHKDLEFFARVVLFEVRDIEGRPIQTQVGNDVPPLAAFLDVWALRMAEDVPAEAERCADDLTAHGEALWALVHPPRRLVSLGRCPFVIEDSFCRGHIRSNGEEGEAACSECEQYGPTEWWEEVLLGNPTSPVLNYEQLIPFIHRAFGRVVARPTLRTWVKRGVLETIGTDDEGRSLFLRSDVVTALTVKYAA